MAIAPTPCRKPATATWAGQELYVTSNAVGVRRHHVLATARADNRMEHVSAFKALSLDFGLVRSVKSATLPTKVLRAPCRAHPQAQDTYVVAMASAWKENATAISTTTNSGADLSVCLRTVMEVAVVLVCTVIYAGAVLATL